MNQEPVESPNAANQPPEVADARTPQELALQERVDAQTKVEEEARSKIIDELCTNDFIAITFPPEGQKYHIVGKLHNSDVVAGLEVFKFHMLKNIIK